MLLSLYLLDLGEVLFSAAVQSSSRVIFAQPLSHLHLNVENFPKAASHLYLCECTKKLCV